jgi:NADH-quinone oxidoreductase subunit C
MLPANLDTLPTPAAIAAWDPSALTGGSQDRGELVLWTTREKLAGLCRFLKEQRQFTRLAAVTCIDRYPSEPRFEVVYLLHSIPNNERLRLKVAVAGADAAVPSVCSVWTGANWYEREVYDMFGVRFDGHPDLRRILMPDYWQGHPLRKDFPVHGHKYSYKDE